MFIVIFIMIGALFIISENNLALKESKNIKEFGFLYMDWLGKIFDNSKRITSSVINLDWLPNKNQTKAYNID